MLHLVANSNFKITIGFPLHLSSSTGPHIILPSKSSLTHLPNFNSFHSSPFPKHHILSSFGVLLFHCHYSKWPLLFPSYLQQTSPENPFLMRSLLRNFHSSTWLVMLQCFHNALHTPLSQPSPHCMIRNYLCVYPPPLLSEPFNLYFFSSQHSAWHRAGVA